MEFPIFSKDYRSMWDQQTQIVRMPTYFSSLTPATHINEMNWEDFKDFMQPIQIIKSRYGRIEYPITPKNVGWSVCDINMFVGGQDDVKNIEDFTPNEGIEFFDINLRIAKQLLDLGQESTQVTFGFNPEDFSAGHHSVARFHTHIRSLHHPLDSGRVVTGNWKDMSVFDRLAVIEPFSIIYYDFIKWAVDSGKVDVSGVDNITLEKGFVTLDLSNHDPENVFNSIRSLCASMQNEYKSIESVFTDRIVDPDTERYTLLSQSQRQAKMSSYINQRSSVLSKQSIKLLTYVSQHVRSASKRQLPREINSAENLYITKGFAGAFSMTFDAMKRDNMLLDFFPRVITTSGPTKRIFGTRGGGGFIKSNESATTEEKLEAKRFQDQVLEIVGGIYSNQY